MAKINWEGFNRSKKTKNKEGNYVITNFERANYIKIVDDKFNAINDKLYSIFKSDFLSRYLTRSIFNGKNADSIIDNYKLLYLFFESKSFTKEEIIKYLEKNPDILFMKKDSLISLLVISNYNNTEEELISSGFNLDISASISNINSKRLDVLKQKYLTTLVNNHNELKLQLTK